jgi:hypothetical protein
MATHGKYLILWSLSPVNHLLLFWTLVLYETEPNQYNTFSIIFLMQYISALQWHIYNPVKMKN